MTLYHLTPTTHLPARCSGGEACLLGPQTIHYSSREEAFAKAEELEANNSPKSVEGVEPLPASILLNSHEALIPPGTYWFGDPSFCLSRETEKWEAWINLTAEATHDFSEPMGGALWSGLPVVACNTAYGDGVFKGSDGKNYTVDAGCLGLVPEALLEQVIDNAIGLEELGSFITIDKPTALTYQNGIIAFGSLTVATGD